MCRLKILSFLLAVIMIFSSTMAVVSAEETKPEELQPNQVLQHDAISEITVVGSMRISRNPTIVPVIGQTFSKAVAAKAVESDSMSKMLVGFRLEPNYMESNLKAGDVAVISAWMRVADENGTASARIQTQDNSITVNMDEIKLTNQWKKYYFICDVDTDMPTVKTSIYIGYPGQLTYMAGLKIESYSGTDADTVRKVLVGEEADTEAEDEEEYIKQAAEKTAALQHISTYICGVSKAYINDEGVLMDENSAEVVPFLYNKTSVFIPLRFAAENYGAIVEYQETDECVNIYYRDKTYTVRFDNEMWSSNGRPWRPSKALQTVDGRIFIAAEDFAQLLGLSYDIDITKKLCILSDDENAMETVKTLNYKDEIYEKTILIPEEAYTVSLEHEYMESEIGIPALIEVTDSVPQLNFLSVYDAEINYNVLYNDEVISGDNQVTAAAGTPLTVDLNGAVGTLAVGEYRVDMEIHIGNAVYYDAVYFFADRQEDKKADDSKIYYRNAEGKLISVPDYRGNRIPDYSGVGYKNGKVNIPDVPAVIEVSPSGGDDTGQIQAAIDYVASLPMRNDGIRGAVQLTKGVFRIEGSLRLSISGVVIRGAGNDNPNVVDAVATGPIEPWIQEHKDTEGTILLLTTTVPESKLFNIEGSGGAKLIEDSAVNLIDTYVPTGTCTFRVESTDGYSVGDEILIKQTGNMAWVHEIGMDQIPARTTVDANIKTNEGSGTNQWTEQTWKFERTITAIDGNKITIDMPIVNAIDQKFGGAQMYHYDDSERIENVGIENMRVVAAWTPNKNNVDETYHASVFADVKNAKDVWFRDITTEHLNTYNITVYNSSKRVTVQDFYDLVAPISFYMGEGYESTGRTFQETQVYVGRYGVYIQGQQVLVQRYHGINLRHLVEYSNNAAGPNVAYDAESLAYFAQMGPHMLWSTGGLYDCTDGQLHIQNRLNMGSGHGWAGAWFTAWNTTDELAVQQPPSAQNWAIGHVGTFSQGNYPQFKKGYWDLEGTPSNIQSLFLAQTEARYGQAGLDVVAYRPEYDMTVKEVPTDLSVSGIEIDGAPLAVFDKGVYNYTYVMSNLAESMPQVTASSVKYNVKIEQAKTINDTARVTVSKGDYSQTYNINFKQSPYAAYRITASTDDGNVPENVADGDFNTRWSASGDGQWISFELEEPKEITALGIAFYSGSKRSTAFDIEISQDGVNWETILSATSSGFTEDLEKYKTKPFTSKYVRFVGHGNSLNAWNSVSEIRFYNQDGELFHD